MSALSSLYHVEFECDVEGNKVTDPVWGYKLTQRSKEARREFRRNLVKRLGEPRRELPDYLRADPRLPYQKPPRWQYGLAFTNEQVMDCVARFEIPLIEVSPDEHDIRLCDAIMKVTELLTAACKMEIHVTVPIDVENSWMVGLFDNYNWWSEQLVEEEEEEVVDIIRRALNIESPLQWYYDSRQP
ncbi:hypothetical protein EWM64_g5512 [Hericium alpestre]|uniref:Uncharacterized protein n=1 Tax=Hericium alpestre TaxID=135208 RepID=A0A4Y9ZYC5_9AGAM|nr:hypothetical protein EWM64_g5512 [Hericium alpestre]